MAAEERCIEGAIRAPLLKSKKKSAARRKRLFGRLAFCRVAAFRWRVRGNALWAGNYEQEAASVRRAIGRDTSERKAHYPEIREALLKMAAGEEEVDWAY